jgi:U3 small nucleolar RNA-associated protein 19
VAAFAKRCARLMLRAPPSGCITMMAFIFSLLQRHPQCRVLIARQPKEKPKQILLINAAPTIDNGPLEQVEGFDPYLPEETDPAKANAFDSCLWELSVSYLIYKPNTSGNGESLLS